MQNKKVNWVISSSANERQISTDLVKFLSSFFINNPSFAVLIKIK